MEKKKLLLLVLLPILAIGLVSGALLQYYGRIVTTVDVEQSFLLDGGQGAFTETIEEPAPGGEEFCFEHYLTNQMSVPGSVNFVSEITGPCEGKLEPGCLAMNCDWDGQQCIETGVTVCQAEKLYEVLTDEDMTKYNTAPDVVEISKKWECGKVIWDIEIAEGDYFHTEFGIVIADNPDEALFQVGTGQMFGAGSPPIYQVCDGGPNPTYGCWAGGSGPTMDLPDGIVITGDPEGTCVEFDNQVECEAGVDGCAWENNECIDVPGYGSSKFHIEIPLKYLPVEDCDDPFYWSVVVRTNAGWALYPEDWDMWSSEGTYAENLLKESLDEPLELESGETKYFCNCYDFDKAITAGTYTITTDIVPT